MIYLAQNNIKVYQFLKKTNLKKKINHILSQKIILKLDLRKNFQKKTNYFFRIFCFIRNFNYVWEDFF